MIEDGDDVREVIVEEVGGGVSTFVAECFYKQVIFWPTSGGDSTTGEEVSEEGGEKAVEEEVAVEGSGEEGDEGAGLLEEEGTHQVKERWKV